jgi:hypothetical protein
MRDLVLLVPNAVQISGEETMLDFTGMRPEVVVAELLLVRWQPLRISGYERKAPSIVIRVTDKDGATPRVRLGKTTATFVLTYALLYQWIGYFLTAFEKGRFDVDHIHLECALPNKTVPSYDLSPTVHHPVAPPLTPKQMRELLKELDAT